LKADESVMTGEPDAVDKEPMGVCIKKRDQLGAHLKTKHDIP